MLSGNVTHLITHLVRPHSQSLVLTQSMCTAKRFQNYVIVQSIMPRFQVIDSQLLAFRIVYVDYVGDNDILHRLCIADTRIR